MAQTRPKPNPRPLRVRNQCQPPQVKLTNLYSSGGGEYQFSVDQPFSVCVPGVEIPIIEGGGGPLTLIALVDNGNRVAFSSDDALLPGTYTIAVPAYLPNLRTLTGGYLAPANFTFTIE